MQISADSQLPKLPSIAKLRASRMPNTTRVDRALAKKLETTPTDRPGPANGQAGAPTSPPFLEVLRHAVSAEQSATNQANDFARGKSQSIPETMISLQKADIQLALLVNVRNKLLDAYREVMRLG